MVAFKVIAGLGNPGVKYERTRHNIGFMVLDSLLDERSRQGVAVRWTERFEAQICSIDIAGVAHWLVKPLGFMNLSGEAVARALSFYKHTVDQLIVVHDEIDLPFGAIRVKHGGGIAGHNGLRSISECLGSPEYVRLRMGVGRPGEGEAGTQHKEPKRKGHVASWVLGEFDEEESRHLDAFIERGGRALECICNDGVQVAQCKFNTV